MTHRVGERGDPTGLLDVQMDHRRLTSAELRLAAAVMEDALYCLALPLRGGRKGAVDLHLEARAWMTSEDRSWPYSFLNLCDVLDLDATAVRQRVLAPRHAPRALHSIPAAHPTPAEA